VLENISQDLQNAPVDEHANEKPPPMGKYTEKSASISRRAMRLFKTLVVPTVAEQGQAVTTAHFPRQCGSLGSVRPVLRARTLELDELWIPEQRNGIGSDEVGFIPCWLRPR
jgi:hypothetical protein